METSKARGTGEEYSSGESGWTAYLGSPNYEEDNNAYRGDKRTKRKSSHYDGESDDSMASDASSGPSHDHRETIHTRGMRGGGDNKYEKDQNLVQTSGKKPKKQTQKKTTYNGKKEAETEEPKYQSYRGTGYSQSQSGAKKIK